MRFQGSLNMAMDTNLVLELMMLLPMAFCNSSLCTSLSKAEPFQKGKRWHACSRKWLLGSFPGSPSVMNFHVVVATFGSLRLRDAKRGLDTVDYINEAIKVTLATPSGKHTASLSCRSSSRPSPRHFWSALSRCCFWRLCCFLVKL